MKVVEEKHSSDLKIIKYARAARLCRNHRFYLKHLRLDEITVFKARCGCRMSKELPHYRLFARGKDLCPHILYTSLERLRMTYCIPNDISFDSLIEKATIHEVSS